MTRQGALGIEERFVEGNQGVVMRDNEKGGSAGALRPYHGIACKIDPDDSRDDHAEIEITSGCILHGFMMQKNQSIPTSLVHYDW